LNDLKTSYNQKNKLIKDLTEKLKLKCKCESNNTKIKQYKNDITNLKNLIKNNDSIIEK
jgi:hypothetical protein